MTFDQLEILEKIIEKGSFKAAAEALHRTQPTLSVAIKKLEDEFDLLLFNRDSYRPVLTPAGEIFYTWARQTLKSYRDLSVVGRELGTQKVEPRLIIVVDPLTRFPSLEAVFAECLSHHRPTELTLHSDVLEGSLDRLLDGEADFAIAPAFRTHPDIESQFFDRIELLPCVRRSLMPKDQAPEEALANLTQIIVRTPDDRTATDSDVLSSGILEAARKCYVSDHSMKRTLILEGFGWGRLAKHEIEEDLKSRKLLMVSSDVVRPINLELRLMRNRRKPMGPTGKIVWNRLRESIRQ